MRKIWTFIRSYAIKLSDIYSYCNLSWEKHLCVFVIFITVFRMKVKVVQSCLTLCYPMDCTVHGTPQARILEWVASSFSRGLPTQGIKPRFPALQAGYLQAESQGKPKNTAMGSLSLLQWIFPTQELNWSLVHCRQSLYHLSYQGSPKVWGMNKA